MPELADNTLDFVYDDAGNRIKKTANGEISYYLNDGLSVLNELDAEGNVVKTIVRGIDQIGEIDASGAITFVHQDVLGSTVLLTNQAGEVVKEYDYDPFGQILGTSGLEETKYLFTGQEYDAESELYYYNARYYNPKLGRFISRDPMLGRDGDSLSRNGFIYVKNNPLKYTDPTGEEEKKVKDDEQEFFSTGDKAFLGATGALLTAGRWLSTGANIIAGKALGAIGFAYELLKPEAAVNANETEMLARCGDGCYYSNINLSGGVLAGAISVGTVVQGDTSGVKTLEMIQPSVGIRFSSDQRVSPHLRGRLVKDVIDDLKQGRLSAKDVPVGYVETEGRNIIVNNKSFSVIKATELEPFLELRTSKGSLKFARRLIRKAGGLIFDTFRVMK